MSKTKIKIIATILVIVLLLGTATGLIGYYSNWFTNWDKFNPKNWFKDTDKIEQSGDKSSGSVLKLLTNNGFSFVSDKIPLSDFSVNGIAETADSAYELTATIEPSIAENKNVCWTARWSNINSTWSRDKDIADYLTFNKSTTQSGESVVLTFFQDFGEQILITATAEADNTKKAICSADYQKRIKRVDYVFNYDNNVMENVEPEADGVYRFDFTNENKSYTIVPIPIYSNYTIDVNYSSIITGNFTDSFGFGSGKTFNNLTLSAGITDPLPDPELSEDAKSFLGSIAQFFEDSHALVLDSVKYYYKRMTDIDRTHSVIMRVSYAFDVANERYSYVTNNIDVQNFQNLFIESYNNYNIPIAYSTFMGAEITSLETFLQNSLSCNNANKGIVEYLIKYSTGDFVYEYKLSLGFNSKSLQAVTDIEIDNGEIII